MAIANTKSSTQNSHPGSPFILLSFHQCCQTTPLYPREVILQVVSLPPMMSPVTSLATSPVTSHLTYQRNCAN